MIVNEDRRSIKALSVDQTARLTVISCHEMLIFVLHVSAFLCRSFSMLIPRKPVHGVSQKSIFHQIYVNLIIVAANSIVKITCFAFHHMSYIIYSITASAQRFSAMSGCDIEFSGGSPGWIHLVWLWGSGCVTISFSLLFLTMLCVPIFFVLSN